MEATTVMNTKKVSISSKRQITIPQKFFSLLGFDTEAECLVRNNELIIRPVRKQVSGEFAEQILADLIKQGLSGDALLKAFKEEQAKVRPAVVNLLTEARAAAAGEAESMTMDDVFGED